MQNPGSDAGVFCNLLDSGSLRRLLSSFRGAPLGASPDSHNHQSQFEMPG
jgi:hypothetical protein